MSERNHSEDVNSTVTSCEKQLAVENEKLRTRLKGYETVAKLTNEKQIENNELKKQNEELLKMLLALQVSNSKEQGQPSPKPKVNNELGGVSSEKLSNDAISMQGLTDLQSSNSSTNCPNGVSSSFTVLGKNSRDLQINNNTPKPGNSSNGSNHQEKIQVLYHPQKHESNVDEKESLNNGVVVESTVAIPDKPQSSSLLKEGQNYPKSSISDEFIQVFPEDWQSGGSGFADSRVIGDQSRINSSKRGPMSIIDVSNGSIPSCHYVEMKRGDEKKDVEQKTNLKSDSMPLTTTGLTTHSDLYSGTGARPKGFPSQLIRTVGEEESAYPEIKPPTSNLEVTTTNMMLKIPCENSDAYRINNAPMLSYGRQESHTEISALTSFELSLPSPIPRGIGKYNNLNMVGHNSQKNLQEKKTEGFVIVEADPPVNPIDPMIPVIKPISDEINLKDANTTLTNELVTVREKMFQLHVANKEWKGCWDMLQKQKEGEIAKLLSQMNKRSRETDRMKQEMEYHIASLKEELSQTNLLKKDAEKANEVLQSGRSQEKQLLEKLKQDYGTLHQEKRTLEIQLEVLQVNKFMEDQRPMEVSKTNSNLETELAVVKRQVTLFMDDFNKEHQERLVIEKRLQKEKELCQSLETKLTRTHSLLKSRDDDLRQKSKQVAYLQFQVDDLNLKLEVEQRKPSIYPSIDVINFLSSQESETTAGPEKKNPLTAHINLNVYAPKPDKWRCTVCTFDNRMSHKKCEICGQPYTSTETPILN